ncbi:ATPase [Kurthia sp. 3B1D]|uniref:Cd(2+)-exporting ATPase n=1 Tax=Candidatus Kurthia intestinigallinarum TaxID=1562256 RepID=A0A433RUM6_9BACL|nr:heavy metal translocating P-type ATPase [Kurthia sp. 3B1D]RUS56959.1 ATPase [Kurthia sp. 3B1D]
MSTKNGKNTDSTSCCSTKLESKVEQVSTCCSAEDSQIEPTKKVKNCCSTEVQVQEDALPADQSMLSKTYRIGGMDCSSCAKSIEKGVQLLPGVQNVQVNFSTAKMSVNMHSEASLAPIAKTVEQLGFTIEQPNIGALKTYTIEGMDCSSCAKSIENHLLTLPEVTEATVQFSTGKLKAMHTLTDDMLASEIQKIGFTLVKKDVPRSKKIAKDTWAMIASTILVVTGFGLTYTNVPGLVPTMLFALVIVISGYKPVRSAFYAIKSKSLDMNVLMSAAAIGAILIGEWFEGATVVWLFAIGTYLQTRSIEKTRQSISNLMDLVPPEAWVKVDTNLVKKHVSTIRLHETIVIKPGEKIPLDGEVLKGESSVNQAPITGESIPVDKNIGDAIFAGTINEHGTLEVQVTKLVGDTTIAKIIHLVEESQEKKAPTEAFVDKFAAIYTPIVFIAALLVIVIPPLLSFGAFSEWFYKGLELLVVACPCALVISTPVAIVSAIGNAARHGVLIKGGTFLEIAGKINTVAFDKTGTLTEGKPAVTNVHYLVKDEQWVRNLAYTLEAYSTHPIAGAITTYVKQLGAEILLGEQFKNIVGKGVQASVTGEMYFGGNEKLFLELGIDFTSYKPVIDELIETGHTVVLIGSSKELLALFAVSDQIRSSSKTALTLLKQSGIDETVMLTGDNAGAAKTIGQQVNVTRIFSNLLPEDKVTVIQQLQQEGKKVAMVGDGINDAPGLATADLGIAMGGAGTDTAMETADIVLMADNLEKLPHTMQLSRKSLTIIKQNIIFSIAIKALALILIFTGNLTLWMAVLSDTGAALLVILNSLRLIRFK